MIRSKPECTESAVLAYITSHRGIRYQNSQLARAFKVDCGVTMPILKALVQDKKIMELVEGRQRYYFIRTEVEEEKARAPAKVREFKSLKSYDTLMRRIADNCVEGR